MAAVVIALATVSTTLILCRNNRTRGWLKLSGGRRQLLNVYPSDFIETGGMTISDNAPPRVKDPGGNEVIFHVSNIGRYEESVETAYYHIIGEGWHQVPTRNPVRFKPRQASSGSPNIRLKPVPQTNYPSVNTPFVVPPERSHKLIYRLQAPNDDKINEITCIKVVTLKGEDIHCRLPDAVRRFSRMRRILCHLGNHG